jgi:hypothetical protein
MKHLLVWTAAAGLLCAACNSPEPRLNAPPHGVPEETSKLQSMYHHMIDNALLAQMTVSDVHFLPHRAILNNLGEQRLSRLSSLMKSYGGVIRFNTALEDQALIDKRVEAVRLFLAEAGIDTSTEVLRHDLPGGPGIDATEAILIKANEATYKPCDSDVSESTSLIQR